MQMQDFLEITHTHADTECLSSMQAAIHTIYWITQEGAHCFARGGRAPSCPWLATGLMVIMTTYGTPQMAGLTATWPTTSRNPKLNVEILGYADGNTYGLLGLELW